MANVQLSAKESVVVYRDPETRRILGFGPENCKPAFAPNVRYTTELCLHARDVERRMLEYREQCIRDAQTSTLRKIQSDGPMRAAIRQSILDRNAELRGEQGGQYNIDLNNSLLRAMDHFYDKACRARMSAEVATVAEQYEAGKTTPDMAMDCPALRRGDVKLA